VARSALPSRPGHQERATEMPSKPKLADPGQLIRSGKLRTDEFRVCMDPDLIAEHDRLLAARDAAVEADSDSLAGGRAVEIDAEIADLLARIAAATITIVLRELPRQEFRRLADQHPARKDADGKLTHNEDWTGVNFETFYPVLIRKCLTEPELDAETLDVLLDERLGDRQWEDLTTVAWNLHRKSVDVPFSPAVSTKTRTSSPK
jgi:hypothetical protein